MPGRPIGRRREAARNVVGDSLTLSSSPNGPTSPIHDHSLICESSSFQWPATVAINRICPVCDLR